ncbi:hypothetical protein DFH09DRAFT_1368065, partial [Mycena vulgaris]
MKNACILLLDPSLLDGGARDRFHFDTSSYCHAYPTPPIIRDAVGVDCRAPSVPPPRGLPVPPIVRDAAECVGVNFSSPVHPIQSHLVKPPSSHLTPLQNIRRTDMPSLCPRGRPASPPSSAVPVRHRQTFDLAHIYAAAPTRSRIATCSPADVLFSLIRLPGLTEPPMA